MTRTNWEEAIVVAFRKKKTPLRVRTRDHTIGRVKTTWYTVRLQEHWFSRICIYRVIASTKLDRLVLGYIGVDFWIFAVYRRKKEQTTTTFSNNRFHFFRAPLQQQTEPQLLFGCCQQQAERLVVFFRRDFRRTSALCRAGHRPACTPRPARAEGGAAGPRREGSPPLAKLAEILQKFR